MATNTGGSKLYGVPSDYSSVNALLLDADGTIRESRSGGFVKDANDIQLKPNVREVILAYKKQGYLVYLLSNQGGIAHGYRRPQEVWQAMANTIILFPRGTFSGVYWAITGDTRGHVPPFNMPSLLRKPETGMPAVCEMDALRRGKIIDWRNSIFVGDRKEDFDCANAIPCPFIWAWDFFLFDKPEELT